jgi:hypothetical protein
MRVYVLVYVGRHPPGRIPLKRMYDTNWSGISASTSLASRDCAVLIASLFCAKLLQMQR